MESNISEGNSTINGKYKILEKKGRGASATVFLTEEETTQKQYAVKVLKEITPTFQNEIAILKKISSLKNPSIVNLIEYGEGPIKMASKPEMDKQYLVLEYASKGELFDYIYCSQKGLKEKYAKLIFQKILKGVKAIHDAGFCHRDLKMQNILVDEKFNPKICDFGFASDLQGKDGSGLLTDYLGTMNYAAPEIFLNRPYKGVKVDIFSLGVVLLNLATCKIGFIQATRKDKYYRNIMVKRYERYWDSVKNQIGEISPELKQLYIKMVCFNPDERPSIEDILNKEPWMREIKNLSEEEYKSLEEEVFEDFKEREIKVKENNLNLESESNDDINLSGNRGIGEDDTIYFDLDINPKLCLRTGLNMNNYIKINGNLKPNNFLNKIANAINSKFEDKVSIDVNKEKLKFDVTFEFADEEEEDENEKDKKLEEELDKLCLEEGNEECENEIERKQSVIQIKLFESMNGGYLLRFVKKGGEIEDYHKNLNSIIEIIKSLV